MELNKLVFGVNGYLSAVLSPAPKIGIFERGGHRICTCRHNVIYAGDPLPQSICRGCLVKLENNYEFGQQCMKNSRILTSVPVDGITGHAPYVQQYVNLMQYDMYLQNPWKFINGSSVEVASRRGSVEAQGGGDLVWQLAGPLIGLQPRDEMSQIFVQDGPSNPILPEPHGLTLRNATEASQENSVGRRNKEDTMQQNPEAVSAVENPPTNAGQSTAECSSGTVEEILGRIKEEPEEVVKTDEVEVEADKQEIVVTGLVQSDEEDALDISKVKTEPVPLSLEMVKQEQSEPAAVPAMAINNAKVKEEASTSSAQSRTRSRRINVECSKCSLVFHREVQIWRHRCIGVSPWYCEPCNKYYKTKEIFSRHKRFNCRSKEYKCIACGSIFSNKIELAHHQMDHLKIKVTKLDVTKLNTCKTCLRTFSSKASLNTHERSHLNGNEKDHYLRDAESEFPHNRAIPQSTETHSGLLHSSNRKIPAQQCAKVSGKPKKQYHCTVCKAVFTNQKLFNAHNRQHGLKNPYRHKKQPMTFRIDRKKGQQEPAALKLEVADKNHSSPDRYTCIICRKSFDTQEILIEHKKLHTAARAALNTNPSSSFTMSSDTLPASKWVCKICGLDCRYSKVLWSHMHEKHSRISFKCSHCPKTFGKLCSLKSHEKIHEPKLRCSACGKQYFTLKALAAHEQSKHVPSAAHLCRKCNIKFGSRSALLIHARNHQGLPKGKKSFVTVPCKSRSLYTCSLCAKTFTRHDSLKRHESIHATGKHTYYPCQICGLKFVSIPNYRAHTEKHFQNMAKTHCPTCEQTFFTQDYNKHSCVKWQNGPCTSQATTTKKFKCELCSAVFATQQARNSHMRIHRKN